MKKILIGAMAIVLLFNTAVAQREPEFQVIVKPLLTSLRGNERIKDNFGPAINFSTGVSFSYPIGKSSFINAGLQYAKKGGKGDGNFVYTDDGVNFFDGDIKYRINFKYFVLPIEYRIRVGNRIAGEFGLGVYAAALLKTQTKAKLSDGRKEKEDVTDAYNRFDAGLSATAKVVLPIGSKAIIGLGLNNQLGIFNVSDGRPAYNDSSIKHNALGLLLEFGFKL